MLGELFWCALPGRPRLSQFYLVLSGCLTISLSQLCGGTEVCSWGLLVCSHSRVAMNCPKEGLLEVVGEGTLSLG